MAFYNGLPLLCLNERVIWSNKSKDHNEEASAFVTAAEACSLNKDFSDTVQGIMFCNSLILFFLQVFQCSIRYIYVYVWYIMFE